MAARNFTKLTCILFGQNTLRILIGAYIVAVAVGLIAGTGATPLAGVYLSPEPAALIGRSAFFILGYLVLTGLWLRPAAVLLGIIMFWSSLIVHVGPGATGPIGQFGRDLVLVAMLFLTYSRATTLSPRTHTTLAIIPGLGALLGGHKIAPQRVSASITAPAAPVPLTFKHVPNDRDTENAFRDDLEEILTA
jgi:uncharacterized membrane protein YphA (DoxX/SURF4 family)